MVPKMTTRNPETCMAPLVGSNTSVMPDHESSDSCCHNGNTCSNWVNAKTLFSFTGIFILLIALSHQAFSQAATVCTTAVNVANFGVDGDLYANTPASANGDDWFFSSQFPGS